MVREKTVEKTGRALAVLVAIVLWIAGVLVALAVGFGMAGGTLIVPFLEQATVAAGWIVIVLTVLGVVLAIIDKATS